MWATFLSVVPLDTYCAAALLDDISVFLSVSTQLGAALLVGFTLWAMHGENCQLLAVLKLSGLQYKTSSRSKMSV